MIAGAAPPQAVIEGMERMGFELTHVYGLTEMYGPAAVCAKHPRVGRASLGAARGAQRATGRALPLQEALMVADPRHAGARAAGRHDDGRDHVPRQHHHEGLPQEPEGDRGGVRRRLVSHGDLAVVHPDGYVKIKDRSKDIIISGGENISSIEVEDVLYRHPAVLEGRRRGAARSEMGRDAVRVREAQTGRHGGGK